MLNKPGVAEAVVLGGGPIAFAKLPKVAEGGWLILLPKGQDTIVDADGPLASTRASIASCR